MDINIIKKTIFYTLDTKRLLREKKRRAERKIAITHRQRREKEIKLERIEKMLHNADKIYSYFLDLLEKNNLLTDIDK